MGRNRERRRLAFLLTSRVRTTLLSVDSITHSGRHASATTTVVVTLSFAIAAIEVVLNELQQNAPAVITALDLPPLRGALEEIVGARVAIGIESYTCHNAWHLSVRAASHAEVHPQFEGVLYVDSDDARRCQLTLSGTMVDAGTRAVLQRFVRGMAIRIAVLSRWAHLN